MTSKNCNKCHKSKPLSSFYFERTRNTYRYDCKSCCIRINTERARKKRQSTGLTKNQLIARIYCNQNKSLKRKIKTPNYSLSELRLWALSQDIFHLLFDKWVESGYKKSLTPSFDRIDDYIGYKIINLNIVTWKENEEKGNKDRVSGKNNKKSRKVLQVALSGLIIKEHYSLASAGRFTGAGLGAIWSCCNGKAKTAGGFKWQYAIAN